MKGISAFGEASQAMAAGRGHPPTQPPDPQAGERLESWKDIANYLNRGVTTVQRWEKTAGLPVHRHDRVGSIFAYRAELDAWWQNGHARLEAKEAEEAKEAKEGRRRWAALVAALAVFLLAALVAFNVGGLRNRFFGAAGPAPIDSIAVLPLKNLMGDPEQDYFVEGMHEALTAELSKISALKVISRTSTIRYKDTEKPAPQIARELGVAGLVEGSVLREGDQVRVSVQLIHAPTDKHLWAENFDRERRGTLALHSDVARAIARQIRVTVTPAEATRLARPRPVNSDAYNAYLQGRYFYDRRGRKNLEKAAGYFQQAIQLDSAYAPAWAGLALARTMQANSGYIPVEDVYGKAQPAAERALALDANLAEAHATMGWIKKNYAWDWAGADASFRRALALAPGNSSVLWGAAALAATLGRFEEGLALAHRATELDPVNASAHNALGFHTYRAGRLEEAEGAFKKALELNPERPSTHTSLGVVYLEQERPQEALVEMEREPELFWRLYGLALAYHALGRNKESDVALAELIAKAQAVAAFQIAAVYAFRGDADRAFEWLERAYAQRDGGLSEMNGLPLLKNLEPDPRYPAFLKKMRLPT